MQCIVQLMDIVVRVRNVGIAENDKSEELVFQKKKILTIVDDG